MLPDQVLRARPIRFASAVTQPHMGLQESVQNTGHSTGRQDRASFSPDAIALARLTRLWGVLSQLFGARGKGGPPPMLDLAALRQAIIDAQENARRIKERQGVLTSLKSSVLEQSEKLVERYYGLVGDGAKLQVVLEEDMGGALAAVSYTYDRQGRMADMRLHVNMSQFTPDSSPNGINDHVIENDRIIAHEMTHAVMGRAMDIRYVPDWFMEGTAEYIAGGAERVSLMLRRMSPQGLLDRLLHPWQGDSTQYAVSYLAVRYFDESFRSNGGLHRVMDLLQDGESLDTAINQVSGDRFENVGDFMAQFARSGIGRDFMRSIDLSGKDPGSIKAGRGPEIVPDTGKRSEQPLEGFTVQWPSLLEGISFQRALTPGPIGFWPSATAPWSAAAAYARHRA